MSIFEFIKNKINTKNKYDVIYSIGADCGCAGNLKRFKLRITSGPFDWLFKASLEQRFVCLMNDFADFLNIEDFEKLEKDANAKLQDNKHDYYFNTKTGFQFLHDFPIDSDLREVFPSVKEKYERRIARFLNNVHDNDKKVLLVWFSLREKIDPKSIVEKCNEYCSKLGRDIDFAFIENNTVIGGIEKHEISSNVTLYKGNFVTNKDLVNGNKKVCAKVFKQFGIK